MTNFYCFLFIKCFQNCCRKRQALGSSPKSTFVYKNHYLQLGQVGKYTKGKGFLEHTLRLASTLYPGSSFSRELGYESCFSFYLFIYSFIYLSIPLRQYYIHVKQQNKIHTQRKVHCDNRKVNRMCF